MTIHGEIYTGYNCVPKMIEMKGTTYLEGYTRKGSNTEGNTQAGA